MTTPAEMMSMRWPTVLFLNERGSSSSSSPSPPSPTMLHVAAERAGWRSCKSFRPCWKLQPGRAGPKPMLKVLTWTSHHLAVGEMAQFVDEDDEAEAEGDEDGTVTRRPAPSLEERARR